MDVIIDVARWSAIDLDFHVKDDITQFVPSQRCCSNGLVKGVLYNADKSLELSSPPWCSGDVKAPLDLLLHEESLYLLLSLNPFEPLRCFDERSSIVRVQCLWSAPSCNEPFQAWKELPSF